MPNLVRWLPMVDPFEEMDRMVGELLPRGGQGFMPAMDVYQTNEHVIVETPLAGIDPKNVNISIENDVLTVEGKMEKKSEVDDKNYYRKEIRTGSFHRAVALPTSVDGDKAHAEFEKGMLKITVPKAERAKPKTIPVTMKEE